MIDVIYYEYIPLLLNMAEQQEECDFICIDDMPCGDGDYSEKSKVFDQHFMNSQIRSLFTKALCAKLDLLEVECPLFVESESGINDGLSGIETPVKFTIDNKEMEIVHSLAKWKRMFLSQISLLEHGYSGIVTKMKAIRKDDVVDETHSILVDQWDWEIVIGRKDRCIDTLIELAKKVTAAIKKTASHFNAPPKYITKRDPYVITTQELKNMYPKLTPKDRENKITRKHKIVILLQVGKILDDGSKHDDRAPDYDDWELNCDILYYHSPLKCALEISSMGIRVDAKSLKSQLEILGLTEHMKYVYHQRIAKNDLCYTAGGGIGQSRLVMLLQKYDNINKAQSAVV